MSTRNYKLMKAREDKGYNQHEFSAMIGLPYYTYRRKELGEVPIKQCDIVNIAKVLHLDKEQIFDIFFADYVACEAIRA